MVVADLLKQQLQTGWQSNLYFWQDSRNYEIDLLFESNAKLHLAEIKSAATFNPSFFDNFIKLEKLIPPDQIGDKHLIYGGTTRQERSAANVLPWNEIDGLFE
jgi:predicted AAA+ superfamily ATPase